MYWSGTDASENKWGSLLNDQLYGRGGNDTLTGWSGNDYLSGDTGNDKLYGYWGNDTLDGGDGNDQLYGNENNDRLLGKLGNDYLNGGSGNDYLDGFRGNYTGERDTLVGGSGYDTFVIGDQAGNGYYGYSWVVIEDFQRGVDTISLKKERFPGVNRSYGVEPGNNRGYSSGDTAIIEYVNGQADVLGIVQNVSSEYLGTKNSLNSSHFTFA